MAKQKNWNQIEKKTKKKEFLAKKEISLADPCIKLVGFWMVASGR